MPTLRWSAVVLVPAAMLAACGGSSGGETFDPLTQDSDETEAAAAPAREEVAGTDLTTHVVPLGDVVFDTFDGGSIPRSVAGEEQVLSLRDAIIPIDEPRYVDASTPAGVLQPGEPVIGYTTPEGGAYAYPHQVLFIHEIVNDTVGGRPILVSFCPLCNSGVVYDRRQPDATELTFGNTSALYENDLVMYDHQTLSYWWQVPGRAIVGELSDTQLEALPSTTTTWERWTALHPDTRVLSLDQGFGNDSLARAPP